MSPPQATGASNTASGPHRGETARLTRPRRIARPFMHPGQQGGIARVCHPLPFSVAVVGVRSQPRRRPRSRRAATEDTRGQPLDCRHGRARIFNVVPGPTRGVLGPHLPCARTRARTSGPYSARSTRIFEPQSCRVSTPRRLGRLSGVRSPSDGVRSPLHDARMNFQGCACRRREWRPPWPNDCLDWPGSSIPGDPSTDVAPLGSACTARPGWPTRRARMFNGHPRSHRYSARSPCHGSAATRPMKPSAGTEPRAANVRSKRADGGLRPPPHPLTAVPVRGALGILWGIARTPGCVGRVRLRAAEVLIERSGNVGGLFAVVVVVVAGELAPLKCAGPVGALWLRPR